MAKNGTPVLIEQQSLDLQLFFGVSKRLAHRGKRTGTCCSTSNPGAYRDGR